MRKNGYQRRRWKGMILAFFFAGLLLFDTTGFFCMMLLAIFVHEGGHLLAARWLKLPRQGFSLDFTGARIEIAGRVISYGEEWLLAAAGPFCGLLFSALGAAFWRYTQYAAWFSCASLLLSLFNLLPIRGFDGGRMLACTLAPCLGEGITARVMRLCSFFSLFLIWATAIYFLLRAGDGISLLFFSMTLFSRFFDACEDR